MNKVKKLKNDKKKFTPLVSDEEKQLVIALINENDINIKNLHICFENGKFIAGIFGKNITEEVKNYFEYNHFIESINDLSKKTKLSIVKCLEAYQKVNYYKYNPMNNCLSENEQDAYYYLENALFREIILWESLAQLYNLYFDMKKDVTKVSYKNVIKKLLEENHSEIDFKTLYDYINEKYNMHNPTLEKGIHDCICQYRHQMTHRYSIAVTSLSFNTNLRSMPDLIYKIGKDYNIVIKYLKQIIDMIIDRIMKDKTYLKILNGEVD